MTNIDLVMDNGELVRIECPDKYSDECYDSLEHAMKLGNWWSPHQFDGCSATYLGMSVDRVAMKRVMAML